MKNTANPSWKVTQGTSRGIFKAPDYESARQVAYRNGFKNPDSIGLYCYPAEHASMRALAIAAWSKIERGD